MKCRQFAAAAAACALLFGGMGYTVPESSLVSMIVQAEQTEETYGDLAYVKYDDHIKITRCKKTAEGEVVIPAAIAGLPVTVIGQEAFYGCTDITTVTIPDGVTSIESDAFGRCTGLTAVAFPDSVISIGNEAFYACSKLTSVTVPESVVHIGYEAFHLTPWLDAQLSSKPYAIVNQMVFASDRDACTGEITISEDVTSIGDFAFYRCESLTAVTIPEGVTSIGNSAFSDCTGLTSVTIPDGVTSIGDHAFVLCTGLTAVTIPDSVTSIGDYAFGLCSGLTAFTIPDSVTAVGMNAFYRCTALTSVIIAGNVSSIGEFTFYDCQKLTSVTLPASVTSIGYRAFAACPLLKDVWYSGTREEWNAIQAEEDNDALCNAMVHCNGAPALSAGDVNGDGTTDASDAALVLMEAALLGAGNGGMFTTEQFAAADVNGDGELNAADAAAILAYAAAIGAGSDITIEDSV